MFVSLNYCPFVSFLQYQKPQLIPLENLIAFKQRQQNWTQNFFEQGDPGHLQLLKVKIESSELRQGKDSKKRQVLSEILFQHMPANILTSLLLVTIIQLNSWKLSGSTSQPIHNCIFSFLVKYHAFECIL